MSAVKFMPFVEHFFVAKKGLRGYDVRVGGVLYCAACMIHNKQ